ncbi:MAG: AAA family ATPase [Actinobacteria bacterium]|nr:AAA family ATPase [Actinomycetota bacterium]
MAARDFVGRQAELRLLRQQVERCLAGEPVVSLVEGEAGIGKTRLANELANEALERGVRVVRTDAEEVDRPPLGLCAGIVRALGSYSTADPALPASERRWEVLDTLAAVLREAAPVLVVLEDLHWADEASCWVLERLPSRLGAVPVHLLATARTDEPGAPPLAGLRRLAGVVVVRGLGPGAVEELVRVLAEDHSVDSAELTSRTGGNPLFVRELLALGDDRELPPVVSQVLARHLRRLDPPVLGTLTALALAGPAATTGVLAAALGIDAAAVTDHLEAAGDAGIVGAAPGRPARFRHSLYGDTTVALAPRPRRRELHAALAAAWSQGQGTAARAAAASHRLAALPLGDAEAAGREALAAVTQLADAGDAGGAAELAGTALDALRAHGGSPRELLARLALARAEGLWATGAGAAAMADYEQAAVLAEGGKDPELAAVTAAGAARVLNPFLFDEPRVRQLVAAESSLPAGDHPARVALLGRLAVLHTTRADLVAQGHVYGDEAVAMARRLGDPALLVTALADRHLVPLGVDGLQARQGVADEIVALGNRLRRPDLAFLGQEWTFEQRFERGDRVGADGALGHLDLYAVVLPSPEWRYKAMFRRSTLHLCDGRRGAALDLVTAAAALGRDLVPEVENASLELAVRAGARLLWGLPDPRHDELSEWMHRHMAERSPPPFLRVTMASSEWARGEMEYARTVVDEYAPVAAALLPTFRGPMLVALLAAMAADVGPEDHAASLRAAVMPYAPRLLFGIGMPMPVSSILGRLATLAGDHTTAVGHHRDALRMLVGMPAPGLVPSAQASLAEALARAGDEQAAAVAHAEAETLASRLGMVLSKPDATAPAAQSGPRAGGRASLRRRAGGWHLESPYGNGDVPESLGVAQLARLLSAPGAEVPATELAGMVGDAPVAADLGPALDARAKREYRRRMAELQGDIDEAEAANDGERATLARLELDALVEQLRRAVGLGGRDRPSGSGAERARVNVTRNIKRATAAIAEVAPALGAHLQHSVRTGRFCAYEPEPTAALDWSVDAGR